MFRLGFLFSLSVSVFLCVSCSVSLCLSLSFYVFLCLSLYLSFFLCSLSLLFSLSISLWKYIHIKIKAGSRFTLINMNCIHIIECQKHKNSEETFFKELFFFGNNSFHEDRKLRIECKCTEIKTIRRLHVFKGNQK